MSVEMKETTAPTIKVGGKDAFVIGGEGAVCRQIPANLKFWTKAPSIAPVQGATAALSRSADHAGLIAAIEQMKKEEALGRLDALCEKSDRLYIELGGVLSLIRRNKWFAPDQSFGAFVRDYFDIGYRTAMYFVQIYDRALALQLPVGKLQGLGWTKMRLLLPVLTKENADHWIKLALETSKRDLAKLVKEARPAAQPKASAGPKPSVSKTVVAFHGDQAGTVALAVAQAKQQFGAKDDAEAIHFVCAEFLEAQPTAKQLSGLPASDLAAIFGEALQAFEGDMAFDILERAAAMRGLAVKQQAPSASA